jgi:hypothetical protein
LFGRGIFLAHAASLRHTTFFARPKSVTFLHSFNRRDAAPKVKTNSIGFATALIFVPPAARQIRS